MLATRNYTPQTPQYHSFMAKNLTQIRSSFFFKKNLKNPPKKPNPQNHFGPKEKGEAKLRPSTS
jgi:hypothetical protein